MTRRMRSVLVVMVLLIAAAVAGHRGATEHVRYYTGLEPESVSCITCHYVARGGTLGDRLFPAEYRSPLSLAVSPDGELLLATASQADTLLVVSTSERRILDEIPVGDRPTGVAVSADGSRAFVALAGEDALAVVDLQRREVAARIPVGDEPAGVVPAADGTVYVANWFGHDLSVVDLQQGAEVRRLSAGQNPYDVAATPDGSQVLLASQLAFPDGPGEIPISEVTLADTRRQRVEHRYLLPNAHLMEGIAVAPEGDLVLLGLVRPKNLIPAIGVARGWMMTSGLGVIDLSSGRMVQLPLDDPLRSYADPSDVVITPDGSRAFVSHSGVDIVTAIDMGRLRTLLAEIDDQEAAYLSNHLGVGRRFVAGRIEVGANPKGMALSPDGDRLYVAERLDDRIAVVDTSSLTVVDHIDAGEPERETVLRRGEKLFNSAGQTFQGQFSCRSCHPGNHVDGLQYDFEPDGLGRNILDNRTLLGIDHTGPFKWNGKNTSMYMQCGMRFARFLTRVEPFPPEELNALVAFMRSLQNPPNRHHEAGTELTAAEQRGKALFERVATADGDPIDPRNRCVTCHPSPRFTDRKRADVGSSSNTDTVTEFDTPQLTNIYQSAPYLHDGRAATLEEIWTRYNPEDTHGITSDFTKQDLNDLVQYLKTL